MNDLEVEARNRDLGRAGEHFVLRFGEARLSLGDGHGPGAFRPFAQFGRIPSSSASSVRPRSTSSLTMRRIRSGSSKWGLWAECWKE